MQKADPLKNSPSTEGVGANIGMAGLKRAAARTMADMKTMKPVRFVSGVFVCVPWPPSPVGLMNNTYSMMQHKIIAKVNQSQLNMTGMNEKFKYKSNKRKLFFTAF